MSRYFLVNHETGDFQSDLSKGRAEEIIEDWILENNTDAENITVIKGSISKVKSIPREEYDYKIED